MLQVKLLKHPLQEEASLLREGMLSSASGGMQQGDFSTTLHPQLVTLPMLEPGMGSSQPWRISEIYMGAKAIASVTTSERRSIRAFRMFAAS